jgi:hypothetical protein
MYAFCRDDAYQTRSIGRQRIATGRDGMRWCFAAPEATEPSQAQFGGDRLYAGGKR